MPTVSPIQSSFNGGEISPSVIGRVDADRYKSSLAKCLNYITLIQGPLDRRPGTYFVQEVKTSSLFTRIIPFQFSVTQSYILEFGNGYIRFYTNHGQVQIAGPAAYEIGVPYQTADLPALSFTQSGDVIYLDHPNYAPAKLLRVGNTDWRFQYIYFKDGPYNLNQQAENTSGKAQVIVAAQMTVNGAGTQVDAGPAFTISNATNVGGQIQIQFTASHNFVNGQSVYITGVTGTTEANGTWDVSVTAVDKILLIGSVFTNAYVSGGTAHPAVFPVGPFSRLLRLRVAAQPWGYVRLIFGFNPYQAQIVIQNSVVVSTASSLWRLGAWYEIDGGTQNYPATVNFHEDRLCYAGAPQYPNRVDCSQSSDYENFAPTELDGTVIDSDALSFNLTSNDQNVMKWLSTDEKGLLGGSGAGEWLIRPSINQEAMTPLNISAKKTTAWGSVSIAATVIGKATVFVQRGAKKLRELLYFFDIDGYRATDLTELAEHITSTGVTDRAYQKIPQSILWLPRIDGTLLGMTYERDLQTLKLGWHRHQLGGSSDAALDFAAVESVAVIPSPDGTRDELWMVVRRYINGATKRYIEYMGKMFEDTDLQEDCHFLDCGAVFDNPIPMSGATAANPVVITATAHGLSNGDQVQIKGIVGMTQLNYNRYTVASVTANTFALHDSSGNTIDGTGFSPYVSGGTVRKLVTTISGLTWLEGETVGILADGAPITPQVVTAGAITLPLPSATVHIGYNYNSDGQLLRQEAGSADGTAIGKTRRTTRVTFMLHRSLGLKFGMDPNALDTITFRTDADPVNHAPPLFTGLLQETIEADYDFDNQLFFRQDQPLPSKILAIALQMQTQDRR